MWICVSSANAGTMLEFDQVDFFQDGALSVPNSEWGEFKIAYSQSSSLQWINVVADPGTANARWIVQNEPLLPSGVTGTSTFSSQEYFDLGVARGTTVSALNIGYVITSTPATAAPTMFDATGSFTIGSSQNIINNGVPSGITTLGAPDNGNLNWNVNFAGLTVNWHAGMPNVVQETNWCGPGAAANSLYWLNQQDKLGLTQSITKSEAELAANMMNNHTGNWDDKEVSGKQQFISDHKLPLEVHYAGGVKLPNNTPITWDWIQDQMAKGQDLEFMTNTHWVVVEGTLSFDGIHLLSYRDDPFQNGAATTAAQQSVIDNRHVWTNFSGAFTNIGNGKEVLQTVVAESPTPEPSTLVISSILSAIFGVVWSHKRLKQTTMAASTRQPSGAPAGGERLG
jgi:hypothetical protein